MVAGTVVVGLSGTVVVGRVVVVVLGRVVVVVLGRVVVVVLGRVVVVVDLAGVDVDVVVVVGTLGAWYSAGRRATTGDESAAGAPDPRLGASPKANTVPLFSASQ